MRVAASVCLVVVGYAIGFLYLLTLAKKIVMNPRRALTKKKRNLPPAAYLDPSWGQHHSVQCNGIQLYYVAAGEQDKPLMLFLHGFPESWYSWRHQLRYFRENYRVVAVDLRGYGRSSRPSSRTFDYHPDKVAEDVRCFIEALGYESCVLVAHDWGGAIAWLFAERHPQMVDRLVVMDCPPTNVFMDYAKKERSQLKRSLYIAMFNTWYLPEFLFGYSTTRPLRGYFATSPVALSTRERMSDDDIEVYKWTISRRGALTAALNYYRCLPSLAFPIFHEPSGNKRVAMPTMVMWGEDDNALDSKMAQEHETCGLFDDITVRIVPSASHWLQQDQPDVVNQLIRAWLQAKSSSPSTEEGKE